MSALCQTLVRGRDSVQTHDKPSIILEQCPTPQRAAMHLKAAAAKALLEALCPHYLDSSCLGWGFCCTSRLMGTLQESGQMGDASSRGDASTKGTTVSPHLTALRIFLSMNFSSYDTTHSSYTACNLYIVGLQCDLISPGPIHTKIRQSCIN